MRIVRFEDESGAVGWGRVDGEEYGTAERLRGELFGGLEHTGETTRVVRLLAPLDPADILCIGLNYRRHAVESNMAIPERPVLFIKATSTTTAPGAPVVIPALTQEPDYECELAVVIGKAARHVSEADALDYVFGYTCANDVSARDWQLRLDRQWARGKSFDTFCPLGPVLVTTDEIPDPNTLAISTTVDGETLQSSNTADMIFSVRQIIAYLSEGMTLRPGTVILTGTPEGVGMGRTPNRWLRPGETCDITIEKIGTLSNPVVAEGRA
jgi:2-keto-4-pentenoate hydratase/2-oxohepta-3-ene-1,7-dioic acid hydratase in catechol pathway